MNVYASTSSADAVPCSSRMSPRSTPPPPPKVNKRFCLSERILFAKARLNRVAQRKHFFHMHEDRFAEQTDLDDDQQLLEAAMCGKDVKVRRLLSNGELNRDYVDDSGRTALHWVAEYGYMKVLQLLLESGWDVDMKDSKMHTPLQIACDHHHGDVASCLVSFGCDIKQTDANGNTPLHRAIRTRLDTIAYLLCDIGFDVNSRTANDWTPLHEAARVGSDLVAKKLLKKGADVNAVSKCNATPFLTAVFFYRITHKCMYNTLEPMLRLFINNGCHLSQSDGQWTPLTAAISVFNSKIAGSLIYHGCLVEREQLLSRSLIVDAFTRCDTFVVKLLVLAGYQVSPDEVEQCARRIPTFSLSFLKLAFPDDEWGKSARGVEIIQFLREKASNPFSLLELSRASIRRGLNTAAGDTSIVDRIPRLPLPSCLKTFISFEDYASKFIG